MTFLENGAVLTEAQCARLLSISPSTLENLRRSGEGPPYSRISSGKKGGVRYLRSRVLEWLAEREVKGRFGGSGGGEGDGDGNG